MTFQSNFPDFPADEVAPSETDFSPDIEHKFVRSLSRIQAFSNGLKLFKFLRSDYNGRLHINAAPTDFNNFSFGSIVPIVGALVLAQENPDRQLLLVRNDAVNNVDLRLVKGSDILFVFPLNPSDTLELTGITLRIDISSTIAGGSVAFLEV